MVVWYALRFVPREFWIAITIALVLQLAGVNVLGSLVDFLTATLLDPLLSWLESQLSVSWTLW